MTAKLYVGNLPYSATGVEIKDLFKTFGEVKDVQIILDRETGNSKGFGFVEFDTPKSADEARKELDGHDFGGRKLRVNEAYEKKFDQRDRR